MTRIARLIRHAAALGLVGLAAWAAAGPALGAEAYPLNDDPLTSGRTAWFREAKFGMFIHWGLYAVPAGVWKGKEIDGIGEWIMNNAKIPIPEYEPLAKEFNPVKFDAKAWARVAKDAGMRYMVITSKHHDGFSMFKTALAPYNIVDATPYGKDPMKPLSEACRAAGLKFCFYHSILDWHHPDQQTDFPKYVDYMKGQLKELVTQYGPLGILWFDGQWVGPWTDQDGRDLYAYVRGLQNDIIINNRVGRGGPGDYETPEQSIPAGAIKGRLWETCMTLNDTWGFKKNDHHWKPAAEVVQKLADIASKGGNFLLNVGPDAEGVIPAESVRILGEVGKWMKTSGDAIYGTTQSPWRRHPWDGRATVKGRTLYLHVFKWPEGGLQVAGLRGDLVSVKPLDPAVGPVQHEWARAGEGEGMVLRVAVPEKPDPADTVLALLFKEPPALDAASLVIRQAEDGTIALKALDATPQGGGIQYESDKDCLGFWTDAKDWVSWDFAVAKPGAFDVRVTWACDKGSGGAEYVVAVADQSLKGKVEETGSWTEFRTQSLGAVRIEKAGKCTLSVKALTKPGMGVMNLRSVVLEPKR